MFFSNRAILLIILLTLLFGMATVCAGDFDGANQTVTNSSDVIQQDDVLQVSDDSIFADESDEILVENWAELQYYSSLNDKNYVLKLKENTNY